jgi:hypothetical protein
MESTAADRPLRNQERDLVGSAKAPSSIRPEPWQEATHPFGNLATLRAPQGLGGPMALRRRLSTGLLLSRMMKRLF